MRGRRDMRLRYLETRMRARPEHSLRSPSGVAAAAAGTRAGARSLLNACWAPAALAAKRRARTLSRKGDHRFDAPPPDGWLVAPPRPSGPPPIGAIRRVKLAAGRKLIALTFDLCEQPGEIAGYDGAIIDYLRQENVKATFFAGGKWMRSHEERARQH